MIRKFGGSSGVESQPAGIDIGAGGGSNIKSIQRISAVFTNDSTMMSFSISPVDISKSVVKITINSNNSGDIYVYFIPEFYDNSTVRIWRRTGDAADIPISIEVITFNNVKSKQSGNVEIYSATTNISISPIDINKSLVLTNIMPAGSYQYQFALLYAEYLTNNNIKIDMQSYQNFHKIYWQVIEFN